MSDCGCKNNKNISVNNTNIENNKSFIANSNKYIFKFLLFLISLILLPLAIILLIGVLFKTIVLNNSIDLMPLLLGIGNIFKQKDNENDEEEINQEELELVGVDEIKK